MDEAVELGDAATPLSVAFIHTECTTCFCQDVGAEIALESGNGVCGRVLYSPRVRSVGVIHLRLWMFLSVKGRPTLSLRLHSQNKPSVTLPQHSR